MEYAFWFIIGLCLGSFANVCIWRIPAGQSVIFPSSRCPECGHAIRWYDNMPLVSFILLKGRCRYCAKHISFRYPVIELLVAVLVTAIVFRYPGQPAQAALFSGMAVLLVIISGIDYYHQIIPFGLSIPLIVTGLASSFINVSLGDSPVMRLMNSFGSAAGGFLALFAIGWITKICIKREALGGGDPILIAGIAAFIGWKGVLATLLFSSLYGTVTVLPLIVMHKRDRHEPFAFGPYLSAGALTYVLLGNVIDTFWSF